MVLMHFKGYASPEPKAAFEQARLFIEQAEALGETPEDPLALFTVLWGVWGANSLAFNGDVVCALAAQFLALAEKQGATVPIMIGHRIMGHSLLFSGEFARARVHYDEAMVLYDVAAHRSLEMRFAQDTRVSILSLGSFALWMLGYSKRARAGAERALIDAREIGLAGTMMYALTITSLLHLASRNYAVATAQVEELCSLADEIGAVQWKAFGLAAQGRLLAVSNNPADAIHLIVSGIKANRSTGSTLTIPTYLSYLMEAHAQLGQFDNAWRCMDEAMSVMEKTKEKWWEAEVHRVAGEIALMSPQPDAAKAEACFERALAVARAQQAKAWELRAAMSMARLLRDRGSRVAARDLLAPVYGWFTEGLDTLDLQEAKALLDALPG